MDDQNFHEIQLSGKQLLFGFMSAVVLLVVVFLLGVSVGRGVRTSASPEARDAMVVPAPGDTTVPTEPPPGSGAPAPAELNYPAVLSGQGGKVSPPPSTQQQPPATQQSPPTQPPPAPPPATSAPPAAPPSTPARDPVPETTAAKSVQKPAPPKPPTPSPEGRWWAQVGAFSTQAAADAVAAEVRSKGFPARVSRGAKLYRVRVGPFASQAEANQEVQRLQKAGITSSAIR